MSEQNQTSAQQDTEGQDGNGLGWFRRMKEGITTKTAEKKEIPEGNWYKCPSCKTVVASQEHEQNLWVCPHCDHHERIGSNEYFSILFDEGKFRELQAKMTSANPLQFKDTKDYEDRLEASMAKTGLKDAIRTGVGEVGGRQMVVSCMDFGFIGGSMGSVVGEKIARAVDYAIKSGLPYVCVTKSGGARMMEAGLSLMQMAKTSARLSLLAKAGLPYICILTDPTTGGVTASYAMLGDLHIAEPNALIGFAGPRVVRETIGKDLPPGFQKSEFLLEHGFVDRIVHRKDLQKELSALIGMLMIDTRRAWKAGRPIFAPLKIRPHQEHPRDFYMYLTPKKKQEFFAKYGKNAQDTGSAEGQIAMFSFRIAHLTEHLKKNRKDANTQRALITMVGKRRRLLDYLKAKDITRYRAIVKDLGLRR